MKKIFLTIIVTTVAFCVKAQSNQKSTLQLASSVTNNTVKENPQDPLVNGIPYSQYKLQVQAEEKRRIAAEKEAKTKQQEWMNKQTKKNLPPIPNVPENAKIE